MSTPPPLEKKIKDGFVKHGKNIAEESVGIGKEFAKASKEIGKSIYKIGEGSLEAGMAVGKGVYGVSKATVKTGVEITKTAIAASTFPYRRRRSLKDYVWKAKQGVISGAADNDPAGIATYSQVGAATGFSLLWLVLITTPMLIAVEEMSARTGVIAKKGLNSLIKDKFGKSWAIMAAILLLICNIATLSADLAGMSAILGIIFKVNWQWFLIPLALIICYLLIRGKYSIISRFLFIVTPFLLLYVITAFLVKPDWLTILKDTFIPNFSNWNVSYWACAVAVLGTTISAYVMFWETSQEIESRKTINHLNAESKGVTIGMIFCNLIFYFIVVCTGATLYAQGITNIETADQAALALKPLAGNFAFVLFAIGIFVSGVIAVPVLAASASYVVSEAFGWEEGLNKKPAKAKNFYIVMSMALIGSALVGLVGINPMKMLFYSQILQGVLTPLLLIFLLLICNDKKIMGQFTNSWKANFWGWLTIIVMLSMSTIMFWDMLR